MKTGNRKVLHDKAKLTEMINLRLIGLSLTSLATLYGVDWTSVRYHTRLYKVPHPKETINLEAIISQILPAPTPPTYKIVNGERINLGRNYKDYFTR